METRKTASTTDMTPGAKAYNGIDRNAFVFGLNPQSELWNGRLAMIGFLAYLLWDAAGYSVLRDVLHFVSR
jgi:Chlorophyll A-B binding protein